MIKKVKEFSIGQRLHLDGQDCVVVRFPTRATVVVEGLVNLKKPIFKHWSFRKMTIRELQNIIGNSGQVITCNINALPL